MRSKKIISLVLVLLMLVPVLCNCSALTSGNPTGNADDFNGKTIGVLTGSVHDVIASENLKDPNIVYFNTTTDMAIALETEKISAYVISEPTARYLLNEYPNHKTVQQFSNENYAYVFNKSSEKGALICRQMNAFLETCRENGTLEEIDAVWFGTDEHLKLVDTNGLTAENGIISFAMSTDIGAPFSYIKNNRYVGYDVDIAVRFCREYGYGIEITNSSFDGMLASVVSGKCDFCGGCITVTPERSESVLFSDANYIGGTVLVAKDDSLARRITSLDQLAGAKLGVQTGAAYDKVAAMLLPDCEIVYYNSSTDMALALDKGKVKSYLVDEPIARMLFQAYPSQRVLTIIKEESYSWAIPKTGAGGEKLCSELNAFVAKCREDGTLDEVDAIWFGTDAEKQTVDYSGVEAVNGTTLSMAICTTVGAPFCYIKDNRYAGYDLDLAVRFCREYGYGLKVTDYDITGLFSCLASGKCDFGACCIAVTEERKETMLFPDPYYRGGIAVVVSDTATESKETGFFASIIESFEKTFIREQRYKLFLSGIGTTLLVVALSLLFGTVLGFAVYFAYYRLGKICRTLVNVLMQITENTPVVVILMILYYIIFGSVDISGVAVSVIGFTLIFSGSVIGTIKVGIGAVDPGQREAALALGYTENSAFMRVILPQAAVHFLPGYKSAIVQLIKGTAIVGYIAVQDLTKVSDIVRSRTYEAFFPLIVTALLYFLMAVILSSLVKRLEIRIDPASRKKIKLLKGVKTK